LLTALALFAPVAVATAPAPERRGGRTREITVELD
jgi:hypothetical protein